MDIWRKLFNYATRFESSSSYKNILFGGGNPLLDMTATVKTDHVLSYDLKPNSSILAEEEHKSLYDDLVLNQNVEFTAGGATQNVFRCFQWMLNEGDGCSTYVGCVGEDEHADTLRKCMEDDGVNTMYLTDPYNETGKCACLIHQDHRTLIADLAASQSYEYEHFLLPKVQERRNEAKIFYFSGYFLSASPYTVLDISHHCFENDKILGLNLSAEFIINDFMYILLPTMYSSDFIFGNETEARCMAKKLKFREVHDVSVIAETLVGRLPYCEGKFKSAIFTQGGSGDIVVATQGEDRGDVNVKLYPIIPVTEIVDTNGAGDSFVGGFLSQVAKGEDIDKCVEAGMYASRVCIKTSGVVYPNTPPHFF